MFSFSFSVFFLNAFCYPLYCLLSLLFSLPSVYNKTPQIRLIYCQLHTDMSTTVWTHRLLLSSPQPAVSIVLPPSLFLTIFFCITICCSHYFLFSLLMLLLFLLPILFVVLSTFCHPYCFLLYSLFSTPTTLCYLARFCCFHYHLSSVVLSKHSVDLTNFCCSFLGWSRK